MAKYATIIDGVVDAISYTPDLGAAGEVMPPWVLVPEEVFAGFRLEDDGSFSAPPAGPVAFMTPAISDRQFFQQLAAEGVITQAEAIAAVSTGTIPAAMDALIDKLPAGQQFPARMLVCGATTLDRRHPMTAHIGALYGWSSEKIDQVWRDASAL